MAFPILADAAASSAAAIKAAAEDDYDCKPKCENKEFLFHGATAIYCVEVVKKDYCKAVKKTIYFKSQLILKIVYITGGKMQKEHKKAIELFGKMVKEGFKQPELMPERLVVISLSEQEKENILTPARLELIRVAREMKPESVKALAERVGRRIDAVSRDLKVLHNYSLLEFVQRGKHKMPRVEKEALLMPLGR